MQNPDGLYKAEDFSIRRKFFFAANLMPRFVGRTGQLKKVSQIHSGSVSPF